MKRATVGRARGFSLALQAAGCLSGVLGLAVLAGWNIPSLFSVSLAAQAERLSSTLGVCLVGLGLLGAGRGWRRVPLACGGLTALLGALGVGGQIFDLTEPVSASSLPETFSRSGPLSVTLMGLAMVALSRPQHRGLLPGLLGSVLGSWGGAAVVGALAGLGSPQRDGAQLVGGLGLLAAGSGLVVWNWRTLWRARALRLNVAPLLTAAAVLTATFYFWHALRTQERNHMDRTVGMAAAHVRTGIVDELNARVLALVRMARRWEVQGQPSRQSWESDAGMYLADYSGYHALAFVDPHYEVRWLVSRQRGGISIPLNDGAGRALAALEQARRSRRPALSEAIDLPQAGRGALLMVPIYKEGRLEGYLAGALQLERLLDAVLDHFDVRDYAVAIFEGPERIYMRADASASQGSWSRSARLDLHGAAWTVWVMPQERLLARQRSQLPAIALLAGLLLAGLSALAVQLAQTAGRRASEAEGANRDLQKEVAERQGAQEALAQARDEMEARVKDRTAELARANQDLTAEIAERNRAEETLRASEQRYRELFDNANDLVYIHDLKGGFLAFNKAAQRLTGYSLEEALGMNLEQLAAPEHLELARSMIACKLGGEQAAAQELAIRTKPGRQVLLEVNTHLVYREGIPVAVQGIARDITERKRLEEELRHSQKMEAVGRLAGGVAHDFNNLLTVIGAYSEMIREGLDGQPRLQGYAQEILWAAERASSLTNRLLAFSRRQVVQPKLLDLNEVVLAMENMLRRLIGEDIDLRTALAPRLSKVKADPSQVEQVIMNLVVNARDAIETGGRITLSTSGVEYSSQELRPHPVLRPGAYVALAVSDTGVGMDAEVQRHLFEPFFTTKETGKGTGLGLSTVYGIVQQCGGEIVVESAVGRGSTFTTYLPVAEEDAAGERGVLTLPSPDMRGERETVLLVEDEFGVRRLVRKMLVQHSYRVLEASNGPEALSIAGQYEGRIDVLLTDVVMPKMSGRELAGELARLHPHIKILYMTGYTEDAMLRHGLPAQSTVVLKKPFLAEELARKLRELLEAGEG